MKKQILAAVIASVGIMSAAKADVITPNDGLLFFRSANVSTPKDVVINLGNVKSLGAFTFDNTGLNSILNTTYGAGGNWYARNDISWGLVAADFSTASTVYNSETDDFDTTITHTGNNDFTATKSQNIALNASQGFDIGNIVLNMGNTAISNASSSGTVSVSVGNPLNYYVFGNSDNWSASTQDATGFRFFSSAIGNSLGYNEIFDYSKDASPKTTGLALTVSSVNGTVGIASVPEPSTYALFGFGALLLVIAYRRKTA